MDKPSQRRKFLKSLLAASIITPTLGLGSSIAQRRDQILKAPSRLKVSLNAFSFNDALTKGSMNIDDMIEFCAEKNFLAVDLQCATCGAVTTTPGFKAAYNQFANSYVQKPVEYDLFVAAARELGVYWMILNQPPPASRSKG